MWAAVLLATHGWFHLYNRFDKGTRVWMFAGLQFARTAAFVALVPIAPIGAAAIGAHVLAKWVPYCVYRIGGKDWPEAPVHLIRLLFFVVLALLLGMSQGFHVAAERDRAGAAGLECLPRAPGAGIGLARAPSAWTAPTRGARHEHQPVHRDLSAAATAGRAAATTWSGSSACRTRSWWSTTTPWAAPAPWWSCGASWALRFRSTTTSSRMKNISLTRNRTVALASGDWLAFIDDDERAPAAWLEQLAETAERFGADGVLGPVEPVRAVGGAGVDPARQLLQLGANATPAPSFPPTSCVSAT